MMGAIKDIVDLTTQLANSVEDRKVTAELMKIANLTLSLQAEQAKQHEQNIGLREKNLELREINSQLQKKIDELIAEKDFTDNLCFDGRFYWLNNKKDTQKQEGPFCQKCYDEQNKLVRLQTCWGDWGSYGGYGWMCTVCASKLPTSGHKIKI